jgi:predicted component of type VI protein secretion system
MKLSLVVLTPGKTEGKVIPVTLSQFVIGRDPQCHLRPASAVISKRHCALLVREGKAYVRDFDSTNGTFVNDVPVKGEVELHHDDRLKVGPLLFGVVLESAPAVNRPTPPPPTKRPAEESSDDDSIAAMLLEIQDSNAPSSEGGTPEVPEGSTVMDLPVSAGEGGREAAKPHPLSKGDSSKEKAKPATGNTSTAAKAILEKYMRRPRT